MLCSFTELVLEEAVAFYAAAMLVYCKSISDQTVAIMEQDRQDIITFFDKLCKPDRVGTMLEHPPSARPSLLHNPSLNRGSSRCHVILSQ